MKRITLWFRAVFGFSQKEINGFVVLSILMVLLLAAPFFYPIFFKKTPYDSSVDEKTLQELLLVISEKKDLVEKKEKPKSKWIPNKYKKKDKKHHVIKTDGKQVDDVKPDWKKKDYYVKKEIVPIQINSADTTDLTQISGIGNKNSKWIIRDREKFGGFYSVYQLAEVYSLDSSFVDKNKKYFLQPNLKLIRKLKVNTATFKELLRHPYIEYKQTKAIVNYRKQHGNFSSIDDLLKIHLITEKDTERLKYYLSFE